MFCCGKKESKKSKQEIHPNDENKGEEKQQLKEEKKEKKQIFDQQEIEEQIKLLENQEGLNQSIKTFKQECTNVNIKQIDLRLASITELLNNPKKYNPIAYGNGIVLIYKVFEKNNDYLKEQIQGDILLRFSKIAQIGNQFVLDDSSDSSDFDEDGFSTLKSYFHKSFTGKMEIENFIQIRMQFISVLECILIWGLWFKNSKYEKTLIKLQDSGIQFQENLYFFREYSDMEEEFEQFFIDFPNKEKQKVTKKKKKDKNQDGEFFKNNKLEVRTLMLGLDGGGKTTLMYKLKLGEVVSSVPTIGFNVETIEINKTQFTVWDVGGQDKTRPLWRHYFSNTEILIFVIDVTDVDRIDTTIEELKKLTSEEELQECAFLIYANKCDDSENSLSNEEITEKYQLQNCLENKKWILQKCCALTGDGLKEGLNWAHKTIKEKQK